MTSTVFFKSHDAVFSNLGSREKPRLVSPFGPELYFSKIDQTLLHDLQKHVKRHNFSTSYNEVLAGMINDEYQLDLSTDLQSQLDNELLLHLNHLVSLYVDSELQGLSKKISNFHAGKYWVNFQKQHEFNPHHAHSGNLSFILYVDIPEQVKNNYLDKTRNWQFNCKGLLEFKNNDNPFAYSPSTGELVIFPSSLDHGVWPFDTQGTRISISGNIYSYDFR